DRWSQAEYRSYANIFIQVAFNASPEAKKLIDAEVAERKKKADKKQQPIPVREVYVNQKPGKMLRHPDTNQFLTARALGGPEIAVGKGIDPRLKLFICLTPPAQPFINTYLLYPLHLPH